MFERVREEWAGEYIMRENNQVERGLKRRREMGSRYRVCSYSRSRKWPDLLLKADRAREERQRGHEGP